MKNSGKALDQNGLQELALRYVSRYATTRHKLRMYLARKLREREWSGEAQPDTETLVERFAELGYIDDALYAKGKADSLTRRGYGARRVDQALYQAGITEDDGREARDVSESKKWEAAKIYARRKRIGPFADSAADRDRQHKQLQAFIRAGHDFGIARQFVEAKPGERIESGEA